MAEAKWRVTINLFEETISLKPAQREAFLRTACGEDTQLMSEVQQMLRSHEQAQAGGFMEQAAWHYAPPELNPQAMVGQRVGCYRLTRLIDGGGMGFVYVAERADGAFSKQVAIKLVRADLDRAQYRRFLRERQFLADLDHPNLARLIDGGETADQQPYLVMEYVEGENLRQLLRERGALPLSLVVEITRQVCAGLNAAHERGIIHRDIKPANIIVSEKKDSLRVKVLDFGIALLNQAEDAETNITQGVIGTAAYMSPEQYAGTSRHQITACSDIYSLGLVVYETLTGELTFTGASEYEMLAKRLSEQPLPPSERRPDLRIPPAIDRVVLQALEKEPAHRPQNAMEFAAALEAAIREPQVPHPLPVPTPLLPAPTPPQLSKRQWATYSMLMLALIGVAVATTWLIWLRLSGSSRTQSPSLVLLEDKGLTILVGRPPQAEQPFKNCTFALFKPAVLAPPSEINSEQTLFLAEGISSDSSLLTTIKNEQVAPGNYRATFRCPGYEPTFEMMPVAENAQRPGYAILQVRPGKYLEQGLKLLLKVQNLKGQPLAKSSFALFKGGIAEPEKVSAENAVILSTDGQGQAETVQSKILPGTYRIKVVCVGYKSLHETVTLAENPAHPGTVTLQIMLEPEGVRKFSNP